MESPWMVRSSSQHLWIIFFCSFTILLYWLWTYDVGNGITHNQPSAERTASKSVKRVSIRVYHSKFSTHDKTVAFVFPKFGDFHIKPVAFAFPKFGDFHIKPWCQVLIVGLQLRVYWRRVFSLPLSYFMTWMLVTSIPLISLPVLGQTALKFLLLY